MCQVKTTHIFSALSVVCASVMLAPATIAVPVVPNFTQGSMTSNTETTSTVVETINSMSYDTGYQHVITGTNIEHDGSTISSVSYTHLTLPTNGEV